MIARYAKGGRYERTEREVRKVCSVGEDVSRRACPGKVMGMAGEVAEYLHGVDRAAEELRERLYEQLSRKEEYRRTGNYMEDVRRENELKQIIEEEILSELVYVD